MTDSPAPSPLRPAKQYALWLLGQREWSAKELSVRLNLKGYPAEEIQACVEYCREKGLQSDQRFAESRTRVRAKSHGNGRIMQELSKKGVDSDIIAATLATAGDELERAQLAANRFANKPWDQKLHAKAWRFLAARGFSSESIRRALAELRDSSGAIGSDLDLESP